MIFALLLFTLLNVAYGNSLACRQLQSCDQCLQNPNCGWCDSANICVEGNNKGPNVGNCTKWNFSTCSSSYSYPPWSTLGNGPSHSGVSSVSSFISRQKLDSPVSKYTITFPHPIYQVAVANGLIFVASSGALGANDTLTAVNESNGVKVWSYTFENNYAINPPTYDSGLVYIQSTDSKRAGNLYAFNASTGDIVWKSSYFAEWQLHLAPMVANGNVCVDAGINEGLNCIDQETGEQLFFTPMPKFDMWTPASMDDRLFSFVGNSFYEIDFTTGKMLWSLSVSGFWFPNLGQITVPVLDLPLAFILTSTEFSKSLVAIDVNKQIVAWNSSVCDVATVLPAVSNGKVFLPCLSSLYVLDATTGFKLEALDLQSQPATTQPIVTPDEVIVGTVNRVFAFSLSNYQLVWTIPFESGNPSLSYNGHLFISGAQSGGNALVVYQV